MLFANRLSQEGKDEVASLSFPITVYKCPQWQLDFVFPLLIGITGENQVAYMQQFL